MSRVQVPTIPKGFFREILVKDDICIYIDIQLHKKINQYDVYILSYVNISRKNALVSSGLEPGPYS